MKAFVLRQHGAEGARLETDFPDPVPGEGDVVVRVRATSLNYHDVFTRRGMPGIRIQMPAIMGLDVAGEIAALGPGVTGWRIGDRVVGDPINRIEGGLTGETIHGGLAEYCRLRAHQLVRIPDGVGFAQATALPCAYGTARRMMFTNGHVASGEKVLILGASGGVGVCCVQLAKAVGATVAAATSSEEKAARLRALGADHIINYRNDRFEGVVRKLTGKKGVDVVFEHVGPDTFNGSLLCLKRGGRLVTCGSTSGQSITLNLFQLYTQQYRIIGSFGASMRNMRESLAKMASGLLPVIDTEVTLSDFERGLARLESRQVFGKIIVAF